MPVDDPMTYLAFLFAAVLLAITPGPGIAYVVARTVAGGKSEGLASCVGTAVGGLVHVLAAAFGLSLLLARSAWAFDLLKYVGAAYLVYLGLRIITRPAPRQEPGLAQFQGARRAFQEGVWVEALNVKTALFFLAFLPQFALADAPLVPQLVLMGCICVGLNTLVDVVAVLCADRLLKSSSAQSMRARFLQRLSGGSLVALGVFLAAAKRNA